MLMRSPASHSGFQDPPSGHVQPLAGHDSCSTCSTARAGASCAAAAGASSSTKLPPSGACPSVKVMVCTVNSVLARSVTSCKLRKEMATRRTMNRAAVVDSPARAMQQSERRSDRMRSWPCVPMGVDAAPCEDGALVTPTPSSSSTAGWIHPCRDCSWARVNRTGVYSPASSTGVVASRSVAPATELAAD